MPLDENPTGKPKEVKGIGVGANGFGFVEGIPITGIKAVFTTKNQAVVTPTFKLDFFPLNYFGAISVSGSFTTDNDHGANFSGLELKIPKADVLGLELKDVDVKYVDSGTFSGSAKVVLKFDDNLTVGAGYGIKNNNFDFLKGSVDDINTPIGAGIYLQGIGFEIHTNPTKLVGSIELSAGPEVAGKTALSIDGSVTRRARRPMDRRGRRRREDRRQVQAGERVRPLLVVRPVRVRRQGPLQSRPDLHRRLASTAGSPA